MPKSFLKLLFFFFPIFFTLVIVAIFSLKQFSFYNTSTLIQPYLSKNPPVQAQSTYPECNQGKITSPCQCGNKVYNAGFCCYHPNANSGIWFDPSYDGCPTGSFYFVDQDHPQASDEHPGTEDLPWKTINHAAEVLHAGDVVLVKEGIYIPEDSGHHYVPCIDVKHSGTQFLPIIIKAYPGHTVIINHPSGATAAWTIGSSKDWVIIDGFQGDFTAGFIGSSVEDPVAHGVVQNCNITRTIGNAIRFERAEKCMARNNIIKTNGDSTNTGSAYISYDTWDCILENNFVRDSHVGIRDKDDGKRTVIRNNIISNCYHAILLNNQDQAEDIQVYKNLILNCRYGIVMQYNALRTLIYNNVFYKCSGYAIGQHATNSLFKIWNNIFSNCNKAFGFPESELSSFLYSNYNNFHNYTRISDDCTTLECWRFLSNFDRNSINYDPLFVNPEANDFHLTPTSPCLNAGIDRQDYDNDGNTTEPINMGAYITGNEIIGPIDLSQYIVEEETLPTCASQNGVCCNENQICQNGTFISSSDCGNLCCTGECVSPSIFGDLNQDNKINSQDFQILIQKFKETQNIEIEDLNSDGIVDIKDIGILMHYWTN